MKSLNWWEAVRIRAVERHYIVSSEPTNPYVERLPPSAKHYLFQAFFATTPANGAIVATLHRELLGFLRFLATEHTVFAAGTWVAPTARRAGLGTRLWQRLLRRYPEHKIEVATITRGGTALIRSLRQHDTARGWTVR